MAQLDVKAWALAGGILSGAYMFLVVLFERLSVDFFFSSSAYYTLVASLYPGVTPTWMGAVLALVYGALAGGIFAGLFAWVHNLCLKRW